MTTSTQPAPRVSSTVFGLLMAAAAGIEADELARAATALAVIAVLAGLKFRPAATLAVLLTISAIVVSSPLPVFAALSGLCAAAYLVLRHAVGSAPTATPPTTIAAVGFAFAGLVATSLSPQLPWMPLLAPVAVIGIYVLATLPFFGDRRLQSGARSPD